MEEYQLTEIVNLYSLDSHEMMENKLSNFLLLTSKETARETGHIMEEVHLNIMLGKQYCKHVNIQDRARCVGRHNGLPQNVDSSPVKETKTPNEKRAKKYREAIHTKQMIKDHHYQ